MKTCRSLNELIRTSDGDISKILLKKFKTVVRFYSLEDLKNNIYLRLHERKYIEKYRPLKVFIDPYLDEWVVANTEAKFSTYICKFIYNYIYAYYNKIDPNYNCVSLDEYKDNLYSHDNRKRLRCEEVYTPSYDTHLYIEKLDKHLEKKTAHKGNFIVKKKLSSKLLRLIDQCGTKGCSHDKIIERLGSSKELYKTIESIEKEGTIRSSISSSGNKIYYIHKVKRRSLHNLFRYYVKDYKDKEISDEFNITIAGVGAMKKSLRKEIKKFSLR